MRQLLPAVASLLLGCGPIAEPGAETSGGGADPATSTTSQMPEDGRDWWCEGPAGEIADTFYTASCLTYAAAVCDVKTREGCPLNEMGYSCAVSGTLTCDLQLAVVYACLRAQVESGACPCAAQGEWEPVLCPDGACQAERGAFDACVIRADELEQEGLPPEEDTSCELAATTVIPRETTIDCSAAYRCASDVEVVVECVGGSVGDSTCTCRLGDHARDLGAFAGQGEGACLAAADLCGL
jgi:hypothetical protein